MRARTEIGFEALKGEELNKGKTALSPIEARGVTGRLKKLPSTSSFSLSSSSDLVFFASLRRRRRRRPLSCSRDTLLRFRNSKKTNQINQIKTATARPSLSSPSPLPLVLGRRRPLLLTPTPTTRPAAFGLGGGGGNNKPSKTNDAMASAAAEAEAAAAKVGETASEAAEALSEQVAAEAAEAGASSALSPAAAATSVSKEAATASTSSLPPAPVRSAAASGRSSQRSSNSNKILSLPRFAQQQRRPTTLAGRRARGLARALLFAGVAYALLSLGAAVMRVARKANSPRAQRLRTVDRNKRVVETLNAVFLSSPPYTDSSVSASSSGTLLTPALVRKLKAETGFSGSEVFRKYLWYLLRERRFDSTAVNDLVALRGALELSDEDVAAAIKERAQRIYDKVSVWFFFGLNFSFFFFNLDLFDDGDRKKNRKTKKKSPKNQN